MAALLALAVTGQAASQANKILDINERSLVQLTIENPVSTSDSSPLVSTSINLAGESHLRSQIVEDGTGIQHLRGHINTHLSGQDATGLQYVVNEEGNIEGDFPPGAPLTRTASYKLISQGSIDNFYIKVLIHISPNGEMKVVLDSVYRG